MNRDGSFPDVLQAARAGDGRAFGRLFEALSRRVNTFVTLRGATDPEGMVSDVFLKVFTHLDRFSGDEPQFNAWVFTIARNQLIDEARRRKRRVEEVALPVAIESFHDEADVEADTLSRLGDDWVVAQLDVLTPDQREVVLLRIVGDLTVDAIAEMLGKRPGAVKAIQRRALRALARSLGGQVVPQ
jgi:RNA polymerase sigma-70 factor, ECF subfamily